MYKKIIARLLILGGCILGTLTLAQPAKADDCFRQCLAEYQNCTSLGEAGCDEVFVECTCSCSGTC